MTSGGSEAGGREPWGDGEASGGGLQLNTGSKPPKHASLPHQLSLTDRFKDKVIKNFKSVTTEH